MAASEKTLGKLHEVAATAFMEQVVAAVLARFVAQPKRHDGDK